jgi:hypothetical protein
MYARNKIGDELGRGVHGATKEIDDYRIEPLLQLRIAFESRLRDEVRLDIVLGWG